MKKRLLAMILTLCLIVGLLPMAAFAASESASVTMTASKLGLSNQAYFTSWNNAEVTITGEQNGNGNGPKYYTSGSALRIYPKNTITVSVSPNCAINSVVVTMDSSKKMTAANTDLVNATMDIDGTTATLTATENATTVSFGYDATASSGHFRVVAITVNYTVIPCAHTNTVAKEEIPATCTEAGTEAGTYCNDCKQYIDGGAAIAAAHKWDDGVTTDPTCTEAGDLTYTCTVTDCGETKSEAIPATGHSYVNGVCSTCSEKQPAADGVIELTVETLGLVKSAPYSDGKMQVEGYWFQWNQLYHGDNGIQMRVKDGVASALYNTDALPGDITKIELTFNTGKSTYDNNDSVIFSFGDAANELTYSTKLSTVAGTKTYTITPDVVGYNYFKLEHGVSYTYYWDSIKVYYCVHEYKYDCDTKCSICGNETRPNAKHEYFYACDGTCMNCYEITNPNAAHKTTDVAAKAPTCTEPGNVAYTTCEYCGGCWDTATGMPLRGGQMAITIPAAHTYDDNCDGDCNVCGEYRDIPHSLGESVKAVVPANCKAQGHPEYWICNGCGEYVVYNSNWGVYNTINPAFLFYTGDHVRPTDAADCAVVKCTLCNEDSYGTGICDRGETPVCQEGKCVKCNADLVVYDHSYGYDENDVALPLCQPGTCIYCNKQFKKIFDCENGSWANCIDGECSYGCGKVFEATGNHQSYSWETFTYTDINPCVGGECYNCGQVIEGAGHKYNYDCDPYCNECGEETRPDATHNITHVEAVVGTNCQTYDGRAEYWTCEYCLCTWADENLRYQTTPMSLTTVGPHSYFYPCDPVCEICYEETNPNAEHSIKHVEAVEATCHQNGNVEYWYCEHCGAAWLDQALTQITNQRSVITPATGKVIHMDAVEPGCHYKGNVEHWYCSECDMVWTDAAMTQVSNHLSVILPETGSDLVVHAEAVKPGCHYTGNIEYWYCAECEQVWQDEALTQLSNHKNVTIPATGSNLLVHMDAVEPGCHQDGNVEYWICYECNQVWTDEALTQLSNVKNVVLPATGSDLLVHFDAVAPACHYNGNVEYWFCGECEGFWTDKALTQVSNSKNVILPATGSDLLVHFDAVAPACHYTGNTEYWICYECNQVWTDEALTQLSNVKNVVIPELGGDVVHVKAVAPTCYEGGNIEHWYCEECNQVWADEARTQLTNFMSVKLGATHTDLVHFDAVKAGCHYDGNIEYWVCYDCESVWQDAALTQLTNIKNVVLPATGEGNVVHMPAVAPACHYDGNIEHWICYTCEQVWQDEALTQKTNIKNVVLSKLGGEVVHVEESCYNVEHWYCEACETVWTDKALTQISNHKNVIKAEPTHKLVHEEESCYSVEHWCCEACETVWADEALTQITNHKNVIKAEPTHNLTHEAESCYNVEHWCCDLCETVWADKELTQITNHKNVIKAEPTHKLVHVEESCYNVEHWYCEACETVWTDKALTQISNHKNVIKAEPTHKLVHVEESCYNVEHWYCEACETVWTDKALTQISNHKNVIKAEPTHKLVHEEETCYSVEHWCCEACETVWADEALTQITNHKNVIKATATHKLVHVEAVKGNCKTIGNIEHWYCEACETVWADEALTKITNHMSVKTGYGDHNWTAATCTTPKTCTICKATVGKAVPHIYSDGLDGTCDVCKINRETTEDRTPVHMFRMYDPNSGEHFYTGSNVERDNLVAAGWKYEGIGFTFSMTTGAPVYRLYDPATGEHLYTMDEAEKAKLLDAGWNFEGIAFNSAYNTEVPQYRLHNPNATRGAYMFTSSVEERDYLISLGWEDQGIAFYSSWN